MITIRQIGREVVSDALLDDELFDRISDDTITRDDFIVPNHLFLGVFDAEKMAGFFWVSSENGTTVEIHCNIFKSHRGSAVEYAKAFSMFMLDNYKGKIIKLNCKIPTKFLDVYYFAKKCGFLDEGVDKSSILKNGEILDRYILGVTLEEFSKWEQ